MNTSEEVQDTGGEIVIDVCNLSASTSALNAHLRLLFSDIWKTIQGTLMA